MTYYGEANEAMLLLAHNSRLCGALYYIGIGRYFGENIYMALK